MDDSKSKCPSEGVSWTLLPSFGWSNLPPHQGVICDKFSLTEQSNSGCIEGWQNGSPTSVLKCLHGDRLRMLIETALASISQKLFKTGLRIRLRMIM
jgi:hypothetical protein